MAEGTSDEEQGRERPPATAFREPYGPPIHDVIAQNNLQEMKATAEAARRALYGVEFAPVSPERQAEVTEALSTLEAAISELDRQGGSAD
jgi:hypothetical protein